MIYVSIGDKNTDLSDSEIKNHLFDAFEKIGIRKHVMVIPPDATRPHSKAGEITHYAWEYYKNRLDTILPALGTHHPMSRSQKSSMFGDVPQGLFRNHNWRTDVVTLGTVPGEFIADASEQKITDEWPAQTNKLVASGNHDLILSIGQVVPHEVAGFAGTSKNLFIGLGGEESINKSHYLGAIFGIERIMGMPDTPVRRALDYASRGFASGLPVVYIQTVVSMNENGKLCTRGLFVGDDTECIAAASALSFSVNIKIVDRPLSKVAVYLDPKTYRSTWLGNKSIYRARMAIENGGELVVIAPGVEQFGEDRTMDAMIRKYGYRGTDRTIESVRSNLDLQANLGAAAHLIHGSSEGRFTITYCPGGLSREEVEGVNFKYGDIARIMKKYDPAALEEGYNTLADGEIIYYISNPGLGLWKYENKSANPNRS